MCTTLYVFFVLVHGARTTAQTTIAAVHRSCVPTASYSTTLLPSSSSSGRTLRVWMIVCCGYQSCFIGDFERSLDHATATPSYSTCTCPAQLLMPAVSRFASAGKQRSGSGDNPLKLKVVCPPKRDCSATVERPAPQESCTHVSGDKLLGINVG